MLERRHRAYCHLATAAIYFLYLGDEMAASVSHDFGLLLYVDCILLLLFYRFRWPLADAYAKHTHTGRTRK